MTGTTVGHYEILEKLGEGGMGLVYKARDVLLNRPAALKFLPAESAGAEDKRRRLIQEAQAASALNHPNIVTIYEVGQTGDRDYIAMELVQGRSLEQVIGNRALPLEKALDYGIQVADALTAAHAAGIVHRDLKPGNVMITESGLAKVLDFGLAKLVVRSAAVSEQTRTMLAEAPKTADGTIAGTVCYMSPEQAEGKPVDHRSDIFAFGAMLYEMVSGRRAFHGESTVSTLAAVLTAEPAPLNVDGPHVPQEVVRVISRSLKKAPEKRWQSIADVRIVLEEIKHDLESGVVRGEAGAVAPAGRRWMPIAAAALAAAVVAGAAMWIARPGVEPPELWRVTRLTSDSGASLSPAISADGRLVAYLSDRSSRDSLDLWVQQVEGGDPVQLTRDLRLCRDPAFSPDGSKIVMHCGLDPPSIYVVPTLGGFPRRLAEGETPRFSPDGSQIAYTAPINGDDRSRSIWIMPADGGSAREIKTGKTMYGGVTWTPDGSGLVFIGFQSGPNGATGHDWYVVPARGGVPQGSGAAQRLQAAGLGLGREATAIPDGFLFAVGNSDSTNIYRIPFDSSFQKAAGPPAPVIVGPGFNFQPAASKDGHRVAFAVGNNLSMNVWRAAVDVNSGKVTNEPVRVTSGLQWSRTPSFSRDGVRMAYLGGSQQTSEVRFRDVASGKDLRLAEAKEWSYPVLSPDGSTIAFSSDQREKSAIYTIAATGGQPKRVCASCGRPVEWFADGTKILFDNAGAEQREIHVLEVASGQTRVLVQHPEYQLTMPRLSPDGKLISFTAVLPGRARRIYVAPFTGEAIPAQQWNVFLEGADYERQPFWAPSGNLIYFLSERDGLRCVWAQRIDRSTGRSAGEPFTVRHMHRIDQDLRNVEDVAQIGLSVAGGQMFFAAFEAQVNIWLAERRAPARR